MKNNKSVILNINLFSISTAVFLNSALFTPSVEAATISSYANVSLAAPSFEHASDPSTRSSDYQGEYIGTSSTTSLSTIDPTGAQISGSSTASVGITNGSGNLSVGISGINEQTGYFNNASSGVSASATYSDRFTFAWDDYNYASGPAYATFSFNVFGNLDRGGDSTLAKYSTGNYAQLQVESDLEYGPHYASVSWNTAADGVFSQLVTIENVKIYDEIRGFATLDLRAVILTDILVDHQDSALSKSVTMTASLDSMFSTPGIGVIDQSLPLAPVPVPAAAWLFGSGLIGLIGVARRKKA